MHDELIGSVQESVNLAFEIFQSAPVTISSIHQDISTEKFTSKRIIGFDRRLIRTEFGEKDFDNNWTCYYTNNHFMVDCFLPVLQARNQNYFLVARKWLV